MLLMLSASGGVSEYMNSALSLSERLSLGGRMILLGLGTVFAVLALIWLLLVVFRLFFYTLPERRRAKEAPTVPSPADAGAPVPGDEELVAVITAAIAEARAAEGVPAASFRVVSFKRHERKD